MGIDRRTIKGNINRIDDEAEREPSWTVFLFSLDKEKKTTVLDFVTYYHLFPVYPSSSIERSSRRRSTRNEERLRNWINTRIESQRLRLIPLSLSSSLRASNSFSLFSRIFPSLLSFLLFSLFEQREEIKKEGENKDSENDSRHRATRSARLPQVKKLRKRSKKK